MSVVTEPFPLRWWTGADASGNYQTSYKLGTSLSDAFKTAIRTAESTWENNVGWSGSPHFYFWENTTPIVDQYDRTLGMVPMSDSSTIGLTTFYVSRDGPSNHFYFTKWYIRFRSDVNEVACPVEWCNYNAVWGTGDADHVLDRQAIATHELGHVILLEDLAYDDPVDGTATMYGSTKGHLRNYFLRIPNNDDAFALRKLYP